MIVTKIQGGLGNQLFQYANAYKYSKPYNEVPILDLSFYQNNQPYPVFNLDKFDLKYQIAPHSLDLEPRHSLLNRFRKILFYRLSYRIPPPEGRIIFDQIRNPFAVINDLPKNRDFLIIGWMQRPDLFDDVKKDLSQRFKLKDEIVLNKDKIIELENSKSIAVHVRRGDMEMNSNFICLNADYYKKAFYYFRQKLSNPRFFIFSDEPDKAKGLLSGENDCTYISEKHNNIGGSSIEQSSIDFAFMRKCKHFILANSTFSWWPAYLSDNPEKIVIAPQIWFRNYALQSNFEKSGLLIDGWIKM